MIELNADIPFLWRLSPESSEGYCSVSLVVPRPPENEVPDLTIETTVLSLASDSMRSEQEETLEWNEEDISIAHTPYQNLPALVTAAAKRGSQRAAAVRTRDIA